MIDKDPFDLDSLRIDPTDPKFKRGGFDKAGGSDGGRRKERRGRGFIKFPWSWAEQLRATKSCATLRLAQLIAYEHWRGGGRTIKLTNIMAGEVGVSPDAKVRALDELERVGLIEIERRPRKSPLVTALIKPATGP